MQDVLLKSVPYLAKFDNAQALTVWLYKVARNRCISSHRGSQFSRAKNLSLEELMPYSHELRELQNRAHAQSGSSVAEQRERRAPEAGHSAGASAVPDGAGAARHGGAEHRGSSQDHGLARGNGAGAAASRASCSSASIWRSCRRGAGTPASHSMPLPRNHGRRVAAVCLPRSPITWTASSTMPCATRWTAICTTASLARPFLASLKNTVEQCRSYRPQCDSKRAEQLRRQLVPQYQRQPLPPSRRSEQLRLSRKFS